MDKKLDTNQTTDAITPDVRLNRGVGTKESEKLGAAMVTILEPKIVKLTINNKPSEIVECMVKHPGKEDLIKVSQVRFLKGDKVVQSGLWFHEDEDGLIPKNSALAFLLKHVGVENLTDLISKKVTTEPGKDGYLAFKAY